MNQNLMNSLKLSKLYYTNFGTKVLNSLLFPLSLKIIGYSKWELLEESSKIIQFSSKTLRAKKNFKTTRNKANFNSLNIKKFRLQQSFTLIHSNVHVHS